MIKIEQWGKDHWSTFAYIETLAVDNSGLAIPDARRMRVIHTLHPSKENDHDSSNYPTRLKGNGIQFNHDDYSCLEDAEAEGLLEDIGTGLNPIYKLTKKGMTIAQQLRRHKMNGGNFANFEPLKEETNDKGN